tara:strand:+ start:224 stop:559 length:336 start_codon:yes stop_codon:yes gene_type:complete
MRWLLLVLFLSSCGLSTLLPLGGSGGPTVNSNAQIGAENRQSAVSIEETTSVGRDIITKEIETGMVEKLNIQNIPPWVMILLLLGWLLPTPTEMGRGMFNFVLLLFGRSKL